MVPNQENMEGNQPVHSYSGHCNHRIVCRSIVLVEQDSRRAFSRPSPQCPYSTTFQSPELLIQCEFIWNLKNNAVSIVEFNAAKFQCCGIQLLLSQLMNFSAHPRICWPYYYKCIIRFSFLNSPSTYLFLHFEYKHMNSSHISYTVIMQCWTMFIRCISMNTIVGHGWKLVDS